MNMEAPIWGLNLRHPDSDPKTSVGYLSPGAVRVNLAEGYWGMGAFEAGT